LKLLESDTQVFIIRIWFERREMQGALPKWRGVVEHLGTGQRFYLEDLAEIAAFIRPYLEAKGSEMKKPE
jgi:hypothetical protein